MPGLHQNAHDHTGLRYKVAYKNTGFAKGKDGIRFKLHGTNVAIGSLTVKFKSSERNVPENEFLSDYNE